MQLVEMLISYTFKSIGLLKLLAKAEKLGGPPLSLTIVHMDFISSCKCYKSQGSVFC